MPNYRYSTPEYMRRNSNMSRQASCCRQEETASSRTNAAVSRTNAITSTADCGCNCDPLSGLPLAMAYVPWQEWNSVYEIEKGLQCGTIFKELNKPFRGTGGCQ